MIVAWRNLSNYLRILLQILADQTTGRMQEAVLQLHSISVRIDSTFHLNCTIIFFPFLFCYLQSSKLHACHQGSSRTGTHGNAVPVLFFIQRERRSSCFFLYTPIVNCIFPWKSFGYKADSALWISSVLSFGAASVLSVCRVWYSLALSDHRWRNSIRYRTWKKWLAHGHWGAYDNQSRKRHATEESRYSHLNKIFEWPQ